MPQDRITITIDPRLLAALDARGANRSQVVAASIERYIALLRIVLRELNNLFTPDERALIRDALNGTLFADAISPQLVDAEITDSLNSLSEKWGVNPAEMRAKLAALTVAQKYALVDAVERWWRNDATSKDKLRRDPKGEF